MKSEFKCNFCEKSFCPKKPKKYIPKYCGKDCFKKGLSRIKQSTWEKKVNLLKKRFEKKVIKNDGCWSWNGPLMCKRGRLSFLGKSIQAHRASWIINFGPIPADKFVCHTCDNPICANPKHLFLGTVSENAIDMVKKGRSPHAKLTIENVAEIKKMLQNKIRGSIIARQFGVSRVCIFNIKKKLSWDFVI